jgi:hypothetical protein
MRRCAAKRYERQPLGRELRRTLGEKPSVHIARIWIDERRQRRKGALLPGGLLIS